MELLRSAAPNMADSVVMHREVLAPPDLEDVFGLVGGNIFHGEQGLNQLGPMRPTPALARYATPIAGLYLCASGSHPGGGVTGLPGHNAARRILGDEPLIERLRRRRAACSLVRHGDHEDAHDPPTADVKLVTGFS